MLTGPSASITCDYCSAYSQYHFILTVQGCLLDSQSNIIIAIIISQRKGKNPTDREFQEQRFNRASLTMQIMNKNFPQLSYVDCEYPRQYTEGIIYECCDMEGYSNAFRKKDTLIKMPFPSAAGTGYRNMPLVDKPSSKSPGMATATPKASASLFVVSIWIFK